MAESAVNTTVDSWDTDNDEMQNKYLVFFLDNQEFAISIKYVVDIINVQPITSVPNVPDFVKGITNLRGKVIPIVDVRLRFGKMTQEYNDRTCIIVVESRGATVGLIIDSVSEVLTLDLSQISSPPNFHSSAEARFVQGVGKVNGSIKLLLDCHAVLDDNPPQNDGEDSDDF